MATSERHSLICCGLIPGGASRIAIRLACCSQWVIIAVCTDFHMPRSTEPSSLVAAVIRSGTITMVTSSAMTRPLMPERSVSLPAKDFCFTGTGTGAAGGIG